ncbi:hypothetical protein Pst134EA_015773, partial [Puccinia striiformis f. sp. tritici]|uniref:hypothetical protein n=1 Tax=Puccinia striiformis f. sp. tritici TaxID=168172 RepID=UPI00200741B7
MKRRKVCVEIQSRHSCDILNSKPNLRVYRSLSLSNPSPDSSNSDLFNPQDHLQFSPSLPIKFPRRRLRSTYILFKFPSTSLNITPLSLSHQISTSSSRSSSPVTQSSSLKITISVLQF